MAVEVCQITTGYGSEENGQKAHSILPTCRLLCSGQLKLSYGAILNWDEVGTWMFSMLTKKDHCFIICAWRGKPQGVFPCFIQGVGKASLESGFAVVAIERPKLLSAYTQLNVTCFSNSCHTKTELGLYSPSLSSAFLFIFTSNLKYHHFLETLIPKVQVLSPSELAQHFTRTFLKELIASMLAYVVHTCFCFSP